jgi:glycosyltransferase involved in cell wall biosynthesis
VNLGSKLQAEVSVVIATHGRLQFLQQAVTSVLRQTFTDIELIVVDNGSRDGTSEFLASIADERLVTLTYDRALGATGACNVGLKAATGKWRCFLHDDDIWAPTKLEEELNEAWRTSRAWAYTGCVYIDATGSIIAGRPPPTPEQVVRLSPYRYAVPAGLSGMIWREDALDDDGLLDSSLTYMVDWDLSLRLLRRGPPAAVLKPLVGYRQHGSNLSLTAADRIPAEIPYTQAKFADLLRGEKMDLAFNYRVAGSEFMRAGMRRAAIGAYWQALRGGNIGALVRLPAILVPRALYPALRRSFLSNRAWMQQAQALFDSEPSVLAIRRPTRRQEP